MDNFKCLYKKVWKLIECTTYDASVCDRFSEQCYSSFEFGVFSSLRLVALQNLESPVFLLFLPGKSRDRYMPFPRALAQSETVLSKNWTWYIKSMFFDNNLYETCTFCRFYKYETDFDSLALFAITLERSCRWHPVSAQSWLMYVFAGWPTLVCPCVGVHWRMLLILASSAVPSMSCLSYLDGLYDGK